MKYLLLAFAADPVSVRAATAIQNIIQSIGEDAKLLVFAAQGGIDPEQLGAALLKNVPDCAAHHVISMNYPRGIYGSALHKDTPFCIWLTQSGLAWMDSEKDRAAFNDSLDFAFGYTQELVSKDYDPNCCFESQFAVPCVDMIPWAVTPVGGRNTALVMISNRGGTAKAFVEASLKEHPHYGWLHQKAVASDDLCRSDLMENGVALESLCEWKRALSAEEQELLDWGLLERSYRNAVKDTLYQALSPNQFQVYGQGWGDYVRPLSVAGMAGVLASSHYAVHASHKLWWHHRLAETLVCGCIPVTREGTECCVPYTETAAGEFRMRYAKSCRKALEFVQDQMLPGWSGSTANPTLPPTPVKFYKNLAELSEFAQTLN